MLDSFFEQTDEDRATDPAIVDKALENFQIAVEQLNAAGHTSITQVISAIPVAVRYASASISTDDTRIAINPDWWTERSEAELRHCAAFIGLSIVYGSIKRGEAIEDCDLFRWHTACNLVINRNLIDMGIGVLPKQAVFITSIDSQATSEEVYQILLGMSEDEILDAVFPLVGGRRITLTNYGKQESVEAIFSDIPE